MLVMAQLVRRGALIVLLNVASRPSIRSTAPALRAQTFHSASSELVVLPVIVTERADHYVGNLTRDDFLVYDNGRRVAIEHFSNEDTPVTVGLIVDASSSMRRKIGDVIAAAAAFVRSSNEADEVFLVSFNDAVHHALPDQQFLPAGDLTRINRA